MGRGTDAAETAAQAVLYRRKRAEGGRKGWSAAQQEREKGRVINMRPSVAKWIIQSRERLRHNIYSILVWSVFLR